MALIEQELYDDSIIIFTSDHGEELCDHHMFRKSRPYEGSCHIPLLISAGQNVLPEIKSSSVCHDVAELRDIMPTLLEIAGTEIPASVDGHSLLPLAKDPGSTTRTWLHGEHSYGEFSNHWIVTETDKYIWYSETGEEQYFCLKEDPHELINRIGDAGCQDRIKELRGHLIDSLKGRLEGFTDGSVLITGRPYLPTLPSATEA